MFKSFLIGDGTIDAQVKINEKEAQEAVWNKKGRVYVATGYQFDGSYTEYDLTEQEKEDLKNFIEENHIELDEQSELLVLKQEMELKNREKGAKLFRSFAGAGKRKGSTDFKC